VHVFVLAGSRLQAFFHEIHPAERAGSGFIAHDLRMHGTDVVHVFVLAGSRLQAFFHEIHPAERAGSGFIAHDLRMHGTDVVHMFVLAGRLLNDLLQWLGRDRAPLATRRQAEYDQ
jgi:hypothetical protein